MLLLKNFLQFILYLTLLLLVVTFEKVVGLPVIFITLVAVIYNLLFKRLEYQRYVYLVISAIFLAVVYQLSFVVSLVILQSLLFVVTTLMTQKYVVLKIILVIFFTMLVIGWLSGLVVSAGVIFYLIFSLILATLLLLKTIFAKSSAGGFLH